MESFVDSRNFNISNVFTARSDELVHIFRTAFFANKRSHIERKKIGYRNKRFYGT